jgi:hypothetical protein
VTPGDPRVLVALRRIKMGPNYSFWEFGFRGLSDPVRHPPPDVG